MQTGEHFPISRLIGKSGPLTLDASAFSVLYFYPKDGTTWCTIQARGFQDLKEEFDSKNIRIIGVSADGADSHDAFCVESGLDFELATDVEGDLGKTLGILVDGAHKRVTYVIDRRGNVVLRYLDAKATDNPRQVLDDLSALAVVSK